LKEKSCRPKAKLFAPDVAKLLLEQAQMLRTGSPVDFDFLKNRLSWEALDHGTPDEDFINALVRTVLEYDVRSPSLVERLDGKLTATSLKGNLVYRSYNFVPPRRLFSESISKPATLALQTLADLFIKEAWRRAFDIKEGDGYYASYKNSNLANELDKKYTHLNIFLGQSVSQEVFLYMDIDTALVEQGKIKKEDILKQSREVVAEVEKAIASELRAMMSKKSIVEGLMTAADVQHGLHLGIALEREIDRIDRLRNLVETPEERARFIQILQRAVGMLGEEFSDIDIQLLESRHAAMGYAGLYEGSANPKQKSKIYVPMTIYGTDQRREINDVLEILAHELAHHKVRKMKAAGGGLNDAHSLDHSIVTQRLNGELRRRAPSLLE